MPEPLIAKIVGEGCERPNAEQELPIDVNYQKLAEWLVARQKLPNDWHKRVQAIHAKISEASKQLPVSVTSSVEGWADSPIDYFKAVPVRDKLAETSDRSLFGGLTGAAAVWDKIVKAYEKNFVYLGEAAQTMLQNTDYEVPYLKKQVSKLNQQVSDFERKQAECLKSALQCAANYKQECAKLGITGSSLRSELASLSSQLPAHFRELVAKVQDPAVADGIEYYIAFTSYAHRPAAGSAAADFLPVLSDIIKGGTAVLDEDVAAAGDADTGAEAKPPEIDWDLTEVSASNNGGGSSDWDIVNAPSDGSNGDNGKGGKGAGAAAAARTGVEAGVVEISWDLSPDDLAVGDGGGAPAEISWDLDASIEAGTTGEDAAAPVDISWDVDVAPDGVAAGGIDWGIDMTDVGMSGAGVGETVAIDWDVDVGGEAETKKAEEAVVQSGGSGDGGGSGVSLTGRLTRDVDYRSRLLDDLQELKSFLVQRKADLSSSSGDLLAAVMPENLAAVDASAVSAMLAATTANLDLLTSARLRQLLLIATSRRYLDRLVASLQRQAGQEARLTSAAKDLKARQQEARAQLVTLAPKLQAVVERTKQIQGHAQRALSGIFAGRRVNILGDINTVLTYP